MSNYYEKYVDSMIFYRRYYEIALSFGDIKKAVQFLDMIVFYAFCGTHKTTDYDDVQEEFDLILPTLERNRKRFIAKLKSKKPVEFSRSENSTGN
jgi:hypothetical protein